MLIILRVLLTPKSKNLLSLIDKKFDTENNILVNKNYGDNSIILNGNGKITWSLNNILEDNKLETTKDLFISSKIELLEASYRSYATIQIKNNKNKKVISKMKISSGKKINKMLTIEIPNDLELSDINVGIVLYCRICTPSNILKIHSIHLLEITILILFLIIF